jgi:predicted esterase YcpF (UPF0227 family)
MPFLTLDILDNKLKHHDVVESNDQHKYARLANASYHFEDQNYVQESFSYMNELNEFEIDFDLSSEEHSVFHNKNTKETVIAYRGTVNKDDVKTDVHILLGNETSTDRFKRSDDVFQKTENKYGQENIVVVGHSLGGGIALTLGEKHDVQSHVYNPAISATQTFSKEHHNNKHTSQIYRTKIDPVSIAGEVIDNQNQKKRNVVTVGNHKTDHAHSLDNFYDNKAKRTPDGSYTSNKENLSTTIQRHKLFYKQIAQAYERTQNIDAYLDGIDGGRQSQFINNIIPAAQLAIRLAKENTDPIDYRNQISQKLNPDKSINKYINLDIEYNWDDNSVPPPLYKLSQKLRSDTRKQQDALMNLGTQENTSVYTETDTTHLVKSNGDIYTQVMAQHLNDGN